MSSRTRDISMWEKYDALSKVSPALAESYIKVSIFSFYNSSIFKLLISCFQEQFSHLQELLKAESEVVKSTRELVQAEREIVQAEREIVKKTEYILSLKDKEVLMAKGLMTARGIFERHVGNCFHELRQLDALQLNERFNVSNLILKLDSPSFLIPKQAKITKSFISAVKRCNSILRDVYDDLSKEQHGHPWTGDSVQVYKKTLKPGHECVIDYIAKEMNLDVIKIDE